MRTLLAAALLLVATSARAQELTVQTDWKIVGVAVATSSTPALSSRATRRALDRASETVEDELPGIRWHVAHDIRSARYEDRDGPPRIDGPGFARLVERLAGKDDELARADVVFLYAPLPDSTYSGMSVLRARPKGLPPIWYAIVNTRQGGRFAQAISKELGNDLLAKPIARLVDRGPGRALALHATTVHEFGHFLAPGTKDIRAANELAGWIGNGEDEPEKHDLRCIMFTPHEVKSVWAKLRDFPRVLQFCDGCRKRLGCPVR